MEHEGCQKGHRKQEGFKLRVIVVEAFSDYG